MMSQDQNIYYYIILLGGFFVVFWVGWLNGAVISAVASHQVSTGGGGGGISLWSLHVLPMAASVVSRYILPYSKDINLDYRSSSYSPVN